MNFEQRDHWKGALGGQKKLTPLVRSTGRVPPEAWGLFLMPRLMVTGCAVNLEAVPAVWLASLASLVIFMVRAISYKFFHEIRVNYNFIALLIGNSSCGNPLSEPGTVG